MSVNNHMKYDHLKWVDMPNHFKIPAIIANGFSGCIASMILNGYSSNTLHILSLSMPVILSFTIGFIQCYRLISVFLFIYLGIEFFISLWMREFLYFIGDVVAGIWILATLIGYLKIGDVALAARRVFLSQSILLIISLFLMWAGQWYIEESKFWTYILSVCVMMFQLIFMRRIHRLPFENDYKNDYWMVIVALLSLLGPLGIILCAVFAAIVAGLIFVLVLYPLISHVFGSSLYSLFIRVMRTSENHRWFHLLNSQASDHNVFLIFLWMVPIFLLLTAVLLFVIRQAHVAVQFSSEQRTGGVIWQFEKINHGLRFVLTDHPVRLSYQKWLMKLHQRGLTIEKTETPRDFLARVAKEGLQDDGVGLTREYEKVRYGIETTQAVRNRSQGRYLS